MTTSPVLRVERVSHVYRTGFLMKRRQVLDGIDLRIREGTIFGFVGANGAGKTTLIQLIVGLQTPTAGELYVQGFGARDPRARARVGYLPERPYFYDHLTGEGLLVYLGCLSGLSRRQVLDRVDPVLSIVGMRAARRVELRKYSKGMLQRIGIAQAILHEPPFLVFDEPMSGLDPLGRKEVREIMRDLRRKGHTIFFSTHVIPDVEAICDEIGVIQGGRVVAQGPLRSLLAGSGGQVEIGCGGVGLDRLRAEQGDLLVEGSLVEVAEGVRMRAPDEAAAQRVLASVLAQGGHVHWVQPVRPNIEEAFFGVNSGRAHEAHRGGEAG